MSKKTEVVSKQERHYTTPIGYFAAKRATEDLRCFKSLIVHKYKIYNRYDVLPIEHLVKSSKKEVTEEQITFELYKLLPVAQAQLSRIGVPLKFTQRTQGEEKEGFHLILDFFAGYTNKEIILDRRQLLLNVLDSAIGYYERRMAVAKRQFWKPTYWAALLMNIPASILSDCGVSIENEKTSRLYYTFLHILAGILLTLAIIKLGISIDITRMIKF